MKRLFKTVNLTPDMLLKMRHRCAWKGCRSACAFGDRLPPGWRWLLLHDAPLGVDIADILPVADRDAVLCPKHAAQLHNELLEDIGQRLKDAEGSA